MTVESVTYISDLDDTYPAAGDSRTEGDDHIRNIKTALGGSFPNFAGAAMTSTEAELNVLDGAVAGSAVASKAVVLSGLKNYNFGTGAVTTSTITTTNAVVTNFALGGSSYMTAIETSLAGDSGKLVNAAAVVPGYFWMLAAESVGTGTSKTADLSSAGTLERIEIAFQGLSAGSGVHIYLRLGTSSTLDTTGYATAVADDSANLSSASTSGFYLANADDNPSGSDSISGIVTLVHLGSNYWAMSGTTINTNETSHRGAHLSGVVVLDGALDIVGIAPASGNLDGGSWKVSYQRSA